MAEAARPSQADDRRANFDFSEEDDLDDEIPAGTIVSERYRVISTLGGGGMGTVYLAEHLTVGRRVAIKVLNGEWSGHKFVARRFQAEARIASTIGHPNIVEVFDAGQLPDKRLFLVMEHLDGHDLAQEIADRGTLSPLRCCEILRQVALALAAAHNVNVIHRDLKPGNIMIANGAGGEVVKILDFGIACSPRATAREGQRLTLPGSVMGTPEYLAPEQSTSAEPNPRFDLYALGAIAFEMLTGDPPMLAEHAYELLVRKRKEAAPSLGTRAPHLHPDLITLVDDCLEITPAKRPLDAIEFIHRLDAFIDELPDDALPDDPFTAEPIAPGHNGTGSFSALNASGAASAAAAVSGAMAAQSANLTGPRAAIPIRPPSTSRTPMPRMSAPPRPRPAWLPAAIVVLQARPHRGRRQHRRAGRRVVPGAPAGPRSPADPRHDPAQAALDAAGDPDPRAHPGADPAGDQQAAPAGREAGVQHPRVRACPRPRRRGSSHAGLGPSPRSLEEAHLLANRRRGAQAPDQGADGAR
jgi:serine/threonine-protein kinase